MTVALQVMLAASKIPEISELRFPLWSSPKIDGVRSVVLEGVAVSRKMLAFGNIFLQEWAKTNEDALRGLDGELVVGAPYSEFDDDDVFNRTSGPVGRVSGQPDFSYHVFDRWNAQDGTLAVDRYEPLKGLVIPRVKLVTQTLIRSPEELKAEFARVLELGYEGLILKNPRGLYKNGRSTILEGTLLKWKEFADSEAQIIGWKQGQTNKNIAVKDALGHTKRSSAKSGKVLLEGLGSWLARDIYSGVEFRCGVTGDAKECAAQWDDRYNLLGKVMTYRFQKVGTVRKPRFSAMLRWRPLFDLGEAEYLVEASSVEAKVV